MAGVVGSILLKFGLGFISDKFRTCGAEKLQDGGLTDQKFRGYILRELDDIKFKLDGLSRKDLSASISFLKQGVQRLQISFESRTSCTSELPKDGKQSQDTTSAGACSSQTKPAQQSVTVEDAVALANAIGKLKIESMERFESAKEYFKEAGKKATEAFHNVALNTNERILATEVRIASGILENLDDPDLAASDCLHYLEELHDMPAIKDIFSVHVGTGLKSWFKSGFKKDSRAKIVETVTMMNLILADFISTFTERRMAVFDWPMIQCGQRFVHPIHYEEENVQKMREMKITPPWDIIRYLKSIETFMNDFAINSKGDVIGVFMFGDHPLKLDRATGEWQPFCLSPSNDKMRYPNSVAIDDNDTVYVVSKATLSVYSSDGKIIHHCTLDFINPCFLAPLNITVTKDKKIIIYPNCGGQTINTIYVCDNTGKHIKSFVVRLKSGYDDILGVFGPDDKSGDKEIIVAICKKFYSVNTDNILLQVYTQEGELKRTINLYPPTAVIYDHHGITFDHVAKNYTLARNECTEDMIRVEWFSAAAELRNSLFMENLYKKISYYLPIRDDELPHLISHTKGAIALVSSECVLYLRYH